MPLGAPIADLFTGPDDPAAGLGADTEHFVGSAARHCHNPDHPCRLRWEELFDLEDIQQAADQVIIVDVLTRGRQGFLVPVLLRHLEPDQAGQPGQPVSSASRPPSVGRPLLGGRDEVHKVGLRDPAPAFLLDLMEGQQLQIPELVLQRGEDGHNTCQSYPSLHHTERTEGMPAVINDLITSSRLERKDLHQSGSI
ncbi:hypothetical protein [Synechococcus sp. MIT S1220]|uniref:hypothetical protein n=1 Tax=Synechococcus sp. MIT S1220 TaxID=3082549 RepID=UPI0039AFEBCC